MTSTMIENVKNSKFRLPLPLLPVVAFGLYLIGDIWGGNLGLWLCNQLQLDSDATNRILLLSVGFIALLVVLWIKFVEGRPVRDLGLCRQDAVKESLSGAVLGLVTFLLIVAIGFAFKVVVPETVAFSPGSLMAVLLMIPFWIVQAGSEELLTRGWVLPEISARLNRPAGVVISSALFVCLHISNSGLGFMAIVNIFLVGVLLSVYALKRDSIWAAVMFHAFWNFSQGSLLGMSVSGESAAKPNLLCLSTQGNSLLSGGAFGIEGSIITTAVLLLLLAALAKPAKPVRRI